MADLLSISARIIDSGVVDQPVNRVTQELSEVTDDIAVVESFSHSIALRGTDGLVVFDASGVGTGTRVVESLRAWSGDEIRAVVYTHGHLDHVGGSPAYVADAAARGYRRPTFVAHEAVCTRLDRYRMTDGWNRVINARQFGWLRSAELMIGAGGSGEMNPARPATVTRFLPEDVAVPDLTYARTHHMAEGGIEVVLHHGRGETDDHTWAWIPSARAICCGDFLIWNFPNAGNPQKVQRYPLEWAAALREMAALQPELLLPAHGLPIGGQARIAGVLHHVADVLEDLVRRTLDMMNDGASLDDIIHTVRVPNETLAVPYLRPLYDEPEFVVRNIWRLYGGWWDANPARLKPPPDHDLSAEVASLAGGVSRLVERARRLADAGELRLASQLVEWAAGAGGDADLEEVHSARRDIYQQRHLSETSLMAKAIFASAARESTTKIGAS